MDAAAFNSPLLRPRVVGEWIGREENDADPLADEMLQPPVPRSKIEQWDSEDSGSPGGSLKMEPKTKGLKHQQQQHKKLLAAMLSQDSFDSVQSTAPSVTEEDIDNEDDAMELLEDLDDLRMEGVTSVISSGSKFNQTRSTHTAEPQAKVTLNICARCARLQGDNMAERTEDVSVSSQTLEQDISESVVLGAEISMESSDELENVPQAVEQELMTKLITETPDHPIPFLIDHLQSKQGGHSQLQRTLSGSAALWAESETSENKGTRRDLRSYDKPWQTNAKKPKKSKSDLAVSNISPPSPESKSLPGSIENPKWDWRSKSEHRDFDELNHILQESKKLGKALENLSRSIAISDELDKDAAAFNSPLLRPRVVGEWIGREENDADPLADEMLQPPVPRSKIEQWDSEDSGSPGGSLKMEPKTKGLKHQQQQHKKLLAAMLSQDSFDSVQSTAPSVTEEDIDNEDDAMELLEDLDDLRMEGVTSVISSGSKFNQTRSTHTAEPQAKVTLNICARCARLQGDNMAERTEDVSVSSQTLEQDISESVVLGAEISMESSDELENVPQAVEQTQPVWDLDVMGSSRGDSPTQKLLKDSLAAKELQTMEKHLADIAKDLALWEEGRLSRNMSNPQTNLVALDHQGNFKVTPSQDAGPQVPILTGKDIQLQLQRNKSPPLPINNRLQVSSVTTSRPQSPSTQTTRSSVLPNPANRAATPNALLQRPLSPSNQGNKEGIISMQRSRSLISKNQLGRTVTTHTGLLETTGDALGNVTQRSSLSEDEFLKQHQLAHQPWILPSDTESEGVESVPDKCL